MQNMASGILLNPVLWAISDDICIFFLSFWFWRNPLHLCTCLYVNLWGSIEAGVSLVSSFPFHTAEFEQIKNEEKLHTGTTKIMLLFSCCGYHLIICISLIDNQSNGAYHNQMRFCRVSWIFSCFHPYGYDLNYGNVSNIIISNSKDRNKGYTHSAQAWCRLMMSSFSSFFIFIAVTR